MKNLISVTAIIIILFVSCKGTKKLTDFNNYTIESLATIPSKPFFDKNYKNISHSHDVGMFEEGTVERAFTILYPDTDKEIHLIWNNSEGNTLYQIVTSKKGAWHSKNGIAIGSTYEQLLKLNKGTFKLYGFGWDYSGAVDWNGGRLENKDIYVFLKPASEPNPKFYSDTIINPSAEELEALELTVGKIIYQVE